MYLLLLLVLLCRHTAYFTHHLKNIYFYTLLCLYPAVGCTDLVPPDDAWLRRNGTDAVVGCYTSHQFWFLRCVDDTWIGVIGNCTRGTFILLCKFFQMILMMLFVMIVSKTLMIVSETLVCIMIWFSIGVLFV